MSLSLREDHAHINDGRSILSTYRTMKLTTKYRSVSTCARRRKSSSRKRLSIVVVRTVYMHKSCDRLAQSCINIIEQSTVYISVKFLISNITFCIWRFNPDEKYFESAVYEYFAE